MILYMYLRKSRADDPGEPADVTLSRHRRILEEFAAHEGHVIAKIFQEVVSGESITARPQMLALLDAVQDAECDGVLCMDIDRLGRGGMKDQGIIIETFQYAAVSIVTPEKLYNLADESDQQMTEFKTFMSRQEYKLITKRMRRGILESVKEGGYMANPPFGYRKIRVGKLPSLEIVPEEAQHIRMAYDMYVNQRIGAHTIAETLNNLGIIPRRNGSFNRNSIRMILKNPTYCGKVAWNRVTRRKTPQGEYVATYHKPDEWLVADGLHEPIISEALWQSAQDIRASRFIPATNVGSCKSPLAGLVLCGNCGQKMQLQPCRGRWFYLRCTKKGCCGSANFAEVEQAVLEQMRDRLDEIALNHSAPRDTSAIDASLTAAGREHATLFEQRSRLMTLLEQGVYTVADYQERMAALTERITRLEAQTATFRKEREQLLGANELLLAKRIQSALDTYQSSDIPTKNALLKAAVSYINYHRESGREQPFHLDVHFLSISGEIDD